MKHSVIENLIGLILMVSAVSGIAGQQTLTGALTGSVLDQVGAVVPGANVTLTLKEGTKGGAARKSATNNEGKFSFLDLPFGEYEIKIWTIWTNKEFRRSVKIDSTKPVQSNISISFEPCSDEEGLVSQKLTDTDRAEIVRELINLSFGIPDRTKNTNTDTIIMSDDNIKLDWVPIEQKFRINVTTRSKIQDRTEKTGELYYFTVSKMTQRGGCVGISMLNGLTAKGQSDDANMAGGGASYEFHKVDGHWIGIRLSAWIS